MKIIEFPKAETWCCIECEKEFPVKKGQAKKNDWIVPCPHCGDIASTVLGVTAE